jgi:hypothetical protein
MARYAIARTKKHTSGNLNRRKNGPRETASFTSTDWLAVPRANFQ